MTKINLTKNIYLYGKYYEPPKNKNSPDVSIFPNGGGHYDIIIYIKPIYERRRIISSLEGFFISEIPIERDSELNDERGQPLVRRDEVKKFEKKYKGKFFSF